LVYGKPLSPGFLLEKPGLFSAGIGFNDQSFT
jgi:hypothetical protein